MYVDKNTDGHIVGVYANAQYPNQEFIEGAELWVSPLSEIVELEAEKPFTHRALRELSLSVAEIAGRLTGQDPLTQPQIAAIAKLDSDIAKLRDQAKLQGLI